LPPMDYSFQYAPLTSEGSHPSQFNRFQIATVRQTKLHKRALKNEIWDTHLFDSGVEESGTPTFLYGA
ncbi:hypothetical protein, partial [Aeromonas caviae]|uniref:hypothetical protein n=1 Tax=Aeromonas caviae TaxID=648 RepID=UPI002B45A128